MAARLTDSADPVGQDGVDPGTLALETADALVKLAAEADIDGDGTVPDERLGVILERYIDSAERGERPFVTTTFDALNAMLAGGWLPGELVYLGASPNAGKSALALEWAVYAAQRGHRVLVVSVEMTKPALVGRMLSQHARVPADVFRSGSFTPDESVRIMRVAPKLAELPIIVDDQSSTLAAVQRLVRRHRPAMIVIDYLQLMRGPRSAERRLELDALSQGLKRLAKRHGCVVLALSQITLIPNGKGGFHRPTMHSLRESRGLTADADTVLLLWQPETPGDLELIVDKGRDHRKGTVRVAFDPFHLAFTELPG
jgi:replicative DNA helicase